MSWIIWIHLYANWIEKCTRHIIACNGRYFVKGPIAACSNLPTWHFDFFDKPVGIYQKRKKRLEATMWRWLQCRFNRVRMFSNTIYYFGHVIHPRQQTVSLLAIDPTRNLNAQTMLWMYGCSWDCATPFDVSYSRLNVLQHFLIENFEMINRLISRNPPKTSE